MNCVILLCGDGSRDRALASGSEGLSLVVVRIPLGAKIRLVEIDGQMIDRYENSVRNEKLSLRNSDSQKRDYLIFRWRIGGRPR